MNFAREGLIFIVLSALLAVIAFAAALGRRSWPLWLLAFVLLVVALWVAYFFRDPERVTPVDDRLVISPADGIVGSVGPAVPPRELELGAEEMTRISVFMNVFSVHVNRAPVRGRIARIEYRAGKFLNAEMDKASVENERNGVVIESPHGAVGVVQVAGLVARRIVCWVDQGSDLSVGDRFGIIRFGARLDVYLPTAAVPRVAVGQTANAGETIIAEIGQASDLPLGRIS